MREVLYTSPQYCAFWLAGIVWSKQTIWDASLAAVCQRITDKLTSVCPHGACHLLPHGRCDLPVGRYRPAAYCVLRALLPPGGAEAPPIRKRRGKRKRMEMQSLPLHPHVITSFLVVAFRCATSPNFCVHIRRVLFFYRTFFQRAVTATFCKRALAPFCSGYTARYSGCAYAEMPRNRAHAPAALKV